MRPSRGLVLLAAGAAAALALAACSAGGDGGDAAELPTAEIAYVLYDVQKQSPVIAEVGVETPEGGISRVVLLGGKEDAGEPTPEAVLVYGAAGEPVSIAVDGDGRPRRIAASDGTLVEVLETTVEEVRFQVVAADDSSEVFTEPLEAAPAGGTATTPAAPAQSPAAELWSAVVVPLRVERDGRTEDPGLLPLTATCETSAPDLECAALLSAEGDRVAVVHRLPSGTPPDEALGTAEDCEARNGDLALALGGIRTVAAPIAGRAGQPIGDSLELVSTVVDGLPTFGPPDCASVFTNAGLSRAALAEKTDAAVTLKVEAPRRVDGALVDPTVASLEYGPFLKENRGAWAEVGTLFFSLSPEVVAEGNVIEEDSPYLRDYGQRHIELRFPERGGRVTGSFTLEVYEDIGAVYRDQGKDSGTCIGFFRVSGRLAGSYDPENSTLKGRILDYGGSGTPYKGCETIKLQVVKGGNETWSASLRQGRVEGVLRIGVTGATFVALVK